MTYEIVTGFSVGQWVTDKSGGAPSGKSVSIGCKKDGELIAGVMMENWNGRNAFLHQRVDRPPPKSYWRYIAEYGFNKLGCKRFTGTVPAANHAAIKLNEHIGFEIEATLKDGAEDGDMLIMVLWKDRCKILGWDK